MAEPGNIDNFYDRLRQNPRPVVVDFWAPWCGPCRAIEPALRKLGQQYAGQVDVWRVNADEQPDVLRSLRIYGIPTLIAFQAGSEVTRRTGAASPDTLNTLFVAALAGEKPAPAGIAPLDRLVRSGAGLALLALAYSGGFAGGYLLLALLGGAVLFSAVHDRCPIWRAISPKLSALLHKGS